MITFKSYIQENQIFSLPTEDYSDLILKVKKRELVPIWRGFGKMNIPYEEDVIVFDPTNLVRKSANTNNFYNLYISEIDPNWKNFPPRNKSLICSFNMKEASTYSNSPENLAMIIPLNLKEKIGICPKEDFWISFPKIVKAFHEVPLEFTLNQFNEVITKLITLVLSFDDFNTKETFSSKENLLNTLKELEQKIQTEGDKLEQFIQENTNFHVCILFEHFKKYGVLNGLKYLFDPDDNGFQVMEYKNIPKSYIDSEIECWVSSKCLIVRNK